MERSQRYAALERMYDGPIPPQALSTLDLIEQDVVEVARLNVNAHRIMLLNETNRVTSWVDRYRCGHFTYGQTDTEMFRLAVNRTCDLLNTASRYLETLENLNAIRTAGRLRIAAE